MFHGLCLCLLEHPLLFGGFCVTCVIVSTKMLPEVEKVLEKLNEHEKDPKQYENGQGYYDDLCLVRFSEGVCCRYIAYLVSFIIFDSVYTHVS